MSKSETSFLPGKGKTSPCPLHEVMRCVLESRGAGSINGWCLTGAIVLTWPRTCLFCLLGIGTKSPNRNSKVLDIMVTWWVDRSANHADKVDPSSDFRTSVLESALAALISWGRCSLWGDHSNRPGRGFSFTGSKLYLHRNLNIWVELHQRPLELSKLFLANDLCWAMSITLVNYVRTAMLITFTNSECRVKI